MANHTKRRERAQTPQQPAPEPTSQARETDLGLLGQSGIYCIKKYGLYRYQLVQVHPETQAQTRIGEANTYQVVASDLVDTMFKEICGGRV